LIFFYSPF